MKNAYKLQLILSLLISLCLIAYIVLAIVPGPSVSQEQILEYGSETIVYQELMGQRVRNALVVFMLYKVLVRILARAGIFFKYWIYRSNFRGFFYLCLLIYFLTVGTDLILGNIIFFNSHLTFILVHSHIYIGEMVLNSEFYINYKNGNLEEEYLWPIWPI